MALNLYRRHRAECEGGHPEEYRSGEFEERSKKWKRCGCVIFAAGTLDGQFRRRQTGKTSWDDAKEVAAAWEATGRWDGVQPSHASAPVDAEDKPKITLDHAVKAFLSDHQRHSAHGTVVKYTIILNRLTTYAAHKGCILLKQWGPTEVRECRDLWTVSARTANRDMSVVRSFFEFCWSNEWIDRNPAKLVRNPRGKAVSDGRHEQKLPFSDQELVLMYDVAEKKYGKLEIKWSRKTHHHEATSGTIADYKYKWSGRDLADFIAVSVYTGLRISDVATFHISRLSENGDVNVRTTKTGAHVNMWLPEWLQEVIRRRSIEVGPYIFGEHDTTDMNVITDVWRRKLKRLWRLCEEGTDFKWSAKPIPHRFRHTFARILLQRPGVEVRDVAELLGNTEQMVRKHYAAWIPERQERLTSVLKAAFSEKPKPNVVEITKSGRK